MTEIASATSAPTRSGTALSSLLNDFDSFLRLLTTQLQNQDPLEPMDSSEFTNQLVQFSQVEQQINTNQNLESLLSLQSLNMTSLALGFMGMNVEATGNELDYTGDPLQFAYSLPENSTGTMISITDENGSVIRKLEGETDAGVHEVVWDGLDDLGQPATNGTYTLNVSAENEEGKTLNINTTVPGYVTGIESTADGNIMLLIGDKKVPMIEARKVQQVPQTGTVIE